MKTKPIISLKISELVEISPNPFIAFLFSCMRVNKEVPDDEIWVYYESGETQKFKLL